MPNRAADLHWDDPTGRPAAGGGLTRAAIVATAVAMADAEGLEGVSIRRVAAQLDARPMSLYTHFASKDDLVELMANEAIADLIVAEPLAGDWREALSQIARRSHAAFVAHPWVLDAFGRRMLRGPNALRHAEQLLEAVAPLGLAPQEAWALLGIVDDYALGHALRIVQARRGAPGGLPAVDETAYPRLAAALAAGPRPRDEASFEAGLAAVLDGIERRLGATPGRA